MVTKKLSIKIFIPISLLLFVFLSILSGSLYSLRRQKDVLDRRLAESERLNALVHELDVLERRTEIEVLSYRFTGQPVSFDTVSRSEAAIDRVVEEIRAVSNDETGREFVERFVAARSGMYRVAVDLLESIRTGDPVAIQKNFSVWSAKVKLADATLNDLVSYNLTTIDRSAHDLNRFVQWFTVIIVALSVGALLSVLLLILYFRQNITMPISRLAEAADRISEKDLDVRVYLKRDDEIGRLAAVFNEMARNVKTYYEGLEGEIRRKEDFIGIASHELKTPLTSLKIYVQSLSALVRTGTTENFGPYLEKIDLQIDKLNKLVADLLDIARIENGKISYQDESFDLNAVVASTIEDAAAMSNGHAIRIEGRIGRPVRGDKERISQVVTNLVSNAIKYSPGQKRVDVVLKETGDEAVVAVRDYGIGIGKEDQRRIFDRFFRVTGQNESTFPGMGVGLYISYQIVAHHKGRMWVESEKGKGSAFFFSLPFAG